MSDRSEHELTTEDARSANANDARGEAVPPRRAIVAGFGPVGRVVVDDLRRLDVEVTVIDMNAATCARQRTLGLRCVHGDVTNPDVLREAGIAEADALVLAIPDENQALAACRVARELSPRVFISARTNFVSKGLLATQAGADHVVVEELATAEAMSRAVAARWREAANEGNSES